MWGSGPDGRVRMAQFSFRLVLMFADGIPSDRPTEEQLDQAWAAYLVELSEYHMHSVRMGGSYAR